MKYSFVAISLHKTGEGVVMTGEEGGYALGVNLSDFTPDEDSHFSQSQAYLALLRAVTFEVNPNWIIDLRLGGGDTP